LRRGGIGRNTMVEDSSHNVYYVKSKREIGMIENRRSSAVRRSQPRDRHGAHAKPAGIGKELSGVVDLGLPVPVEGALRWPALSGSGRGLAIAQAYRRHQGLLLVVAADAHEAWTLEQEIRFYCDRGVEILSFPDWETLPYDVFSPHEDIVSQRLETLYRLPELSQAILVVPVTTLMLRTVPQSFLDAHSLLVSRGQKFGITLFRERLERAGYSCVGQVVSRGEFAVRGSVVDLFPMGASTPYRIDLLDDEIESLRSFNPETQLSLEKVDSVRLLPAREYPSDPDATKLFRQQFRQAFDSDPAESSIYQQVSRGASPPGIEYYLPLFFMGTQTLFDYLPSGALRVVSGSALTAAQKYEQEVGVRYEQRRHDRDRPLLDPGRLYVAYDELRHGLFEGTTIQLAGNGEAPEPLTAVVPDVTIDLRKSEPAHDLGIFLERNTSRTLFLADSLGRREMLQETLSKYGMRPAQVSGWQEFLAREERLCMTVSPMEQSLHLPESGIAVITEQLLFGHKVQQRKRKSQTRDPAALIRDLTDLREGAPVVHEDHGVGRYLGLQTLQLDDIENEFLTIEYAGGDKLYVPVSSLHLVSRYTGADPEHAPLHRLGGEQWDKAKRKAAAQAHDVAAELLDISARRATRLAPVAEVERAQYEAFSGGFPFEETPDQLAAIDQVLADLAKPRPMDRLVCGDVGFGKTEVAIRAAFVTAMSGRQVALLAPTTLLAQQHYANFRDRFADWPVRIELLSRFRSAQEVKQATDALAEGRADIVIGTHKLLQSGVRYKNLGLVIVDEEHRFGVRDKERLKSLRAEVHVLTLTATPIPRTLNLSLHGLRDLSIIATPPVNRHAIKTFVAEWSDSLISEALMRELKRGGQVYFVHNEIKSITQVARRVAQLHPAASVRIAHGQMPERELEQVMLDFYHQRFNVLVCTTIIESGIDVPTANTIIINRADKLGLSQLHQIRGRVGRSHHRAYAFLLAPPRGAMTSDAVKRLEAIESLEDLGVGFMLATHDLEIRGAGELLGQEQSGQIQEIGFGLYQELLNRAVAALRSGRIPDLEGTSLRGAEVDLGCAALLPEDYIPDVHTRLVLYKRISLARDADALDELQVEMIDRFGLLPERARNLFAVMQIKLAAVPLGIDKLQAHERGLRLHFNDDPSIDFTRLIGLVQREPKRYVLDGRNKLRFNQPLPTMGQRVEAASHLLDKLALNKAA
jgi:transcription-repair coupling factor (superfamily II helicase)